MGNVSGRASSESTRQVGPHLMADFKGSDSGSYHRRGGDYAAAGQLYPREEAAAWYKKPLIPTGQKCFHFSFSMPILWLLSECSLKQKKSGK